MAKKKADENKAIDPREEDKAEPMFPAVTEEPEPETKGEKISATAKRKRKGAYFAV